MSAAAGSVRSASRAAESVDIGWRMWRVCGTRGAVGRGGPAPRLVAVGWRLDKARADILRRCLVLIADHELNASTFVARCVASTGATPYAVVSAALSALSGRRHGGASARAEALFAEIARGGDPMAVMAGRFAPGGDLPAFGPFLS